MYFSFLGVLKILERTLEGISNKKLYTISGEIVLDNIYMTANRCPCFHRAEESQNREPGRQPELKLEPVEAPSPAGSPGGAGGHTPTQETQTKPRHPAATGQLRPCCIHPQLPPQHIPEPHPPALPPCQRPTDSTPDPQLSECASHQLQPSPASDPQRAVVPPAGQVRGRRPLEAEADFGAEKPRQEDSGEGEAGSSSASKFAVRQGGGDGVADLSG